MVLADVEDIRKKTKGLSQSGGKSPREGRGQVKRKAKEEVSGTRDVTGYSDKDRELAIG